MGKREALDRQLARAALLRARAAIDQALEELDEELRPAQSLADVRASELDVRAPRASDGDRLSARAPAAAPLPAFSSGDTPMTLEDLDVSVLERVIASLPTVFDTYHVVEHPDFQAAHSHLLERSAVNQLTGKVLRRNAPALRLAYLGPRGRRRSALWQRQQF